MSKLSGKVPRSFMLISAENKEHIKKYSNSADAIIIDLEDTVGESAKNKARTNAVEWLTSLAESTSDSSSKFSFNLRINSLKTGFGGDDFCYCFPHIKPHTTLVYPQVDHIRDIKDLERLLLEQIELEPYTKLNVPMNLIIDMESAKGFVNLREIVHYAKHDSKVFTLKGLIFGSIDYIKSMGRLPRFYDNQYLDIPRYQLAQIARAYDVLSIDMMTNDENLDILKDEATKAYNMGYTSKISIKKEQNKIINEFMMPSKNVVQWAIEVKRKYEDAMKNNQDSIVHEGETIDKSAYIQAKKVSEIESAFEVKGK